MPLRRTPRTVRSARTVLAWSLAVAVCALAGLGVASTAGAAVTAASSAHVHRAAASVSGLRLTLRYCWSLTVFKPTCPSATLTLSPNGTINSMPGSSWTETATTLVVDFINPTSVVTRTTYSGTLMPGSSTCYAGTMIATRNLVPPTMTGVWQGCAS